MGGGYLFARAQQCLWVGGFLLDDACEIVGVHMVTLDDNNTGL